MRGAMGGRQTLLGAKTANLNFLQWSSGAEGGNEGGRREEGPAAGAGAAHVVGLRIEGRNEGGSRDVATERGETGLAGECGGDGRKSGRATGLFHISGT